MRNFQSDPIFDQLIKYESQNLESMQKVHDEVKLDLFELQKNFLAGEFRAVTTLDRAWLQR